MSSLPSRSSHLRLVHVGTEEPSDATSAVNFDALFQRYAPYVASIGLRLLGRPDEVDDLVQDVFFTAHRKLHQLNDQNAPKAWLATIAVRQAQRRLRKRRLRGWIGLDQWDGYDTISDPGAPPEVKMEVQALFRALEGLAPELRIAWTLKQLEGEKLEDIARMCGCSTRTVKRRVQKARALLAEVWDD